MAYDAIMGEGNEGEFTFCLPRGLMERRKTVDSIADHVIYNIDPVELLFRSSEKNRRVIEDIGRIPNRVHRVRLGEGNGEFDITATEIGYRSPESEIEVQLLRNTFLVPELDREDVPAGKVYEVIRMGVDNESGYEGHIYLARVLEQEEDIQTRLLGLLGLEQL